MVLDRLLRTGEGKTLKRLRKIAEHINAIEDDFVELPDTELRGKTDDLRARYGDGETLDELLPEAFATVREAAKRVLGQRHFDVQLMGGAALHLGHVAEMKPGEGKTLVSTLPAYLNALAGEGVHIVTVNDYLASRDAEWMGRIHRFLGLTVGTVLAEMTPEQRREAYHADITYGTNNEFGFDYLRDNMAWSLEECVQRGHSFAIVDEVDSILIDEARTPLIISGPAEQSARWYTEFARIVKRLQRGEAGVNSIKEGQIEETGDYSVDEKKRTVSVHERGVAKVEDQLGIENLYKAENTPLVGYLNNAIKAKELFIKDKEYIVRNGEVLIVDEFTGRVLAGRRFNEGMHQAIEAKEGVEIKAENQTLATITLQNFFRLYDKLAGMTGTAETEAAEFAQTYKLGVTVIPTNEPMVRADNKDLIYKSEESKFLAAAEDIAECHHRGQPVLVGTTSVEKSEYLSNLLVNEGIPHEVLNAKYHEREAAIIAEAGRKGAVTVSTNMAGRGTDIMLGGNPEHSAETALRERGLDPEETAEEWIAAYGPELSKAKESVKAEADEVREAGGLYVLATERHESRRIDNQLRGRSGRQGDPGQSRFYLSLGDELMRRFNSQMVETVMTRLKVPDDVPIEASMVTKAIRNAQTQVEQQNFEIRKNVLKYDEVMNEQRKVIYSERRRVLEGEDLADQVGHMVEDVVSAYVRGATSGSYSEDWDLDQLWGALGGLYPVSLRWQDLVVGELGEDDDEDVPLDDISAETLQDKVLEDAHDAYARREAEIDALVGEGGMRELERRVLLSVLDRKWREHLYEMDYLKEGIGLRAMAQRQPEIEYQREGFDMFKAMLDGLKEEAVSFLFHLQVEVAEPEDEESGDGVPLGVGAGGDGVAGAAAPNSETSAPGRHAAAEPGSGLGDSARLSDGGEPQAERLTYSGPDEAGDAASHASTDGTHGSAGEPAEPAAAAATNGGGTRRARREAARAAAKDRKKQRTHS
jgi:preprotein translocase subunit SecA